MSGPARCMQLWWSAVVVTRVCVFFFGLVWFLFSLFILFAFNSVDLILGLARVIGARSVFVCFYAPVVLYGYSALSMNPRGVGRSLSKSICPT